MIPRREIDDAGRLAKQIGIKHVIIEYNELKNNDFVKKPPNRCYICRKLRDALIKEWARENGFETVADGLNYSDLSDYRPGLQASTEDGIWHPFIEYQITKEEIREYSRLIGLPTWNKPSTPCLATRFPYGFNLTVERIRVVEKAEEYIKQLGFRNVESDTFHTIQH